MNSRRVVISGIGMVSPAGIGLEPYWKAVLAADSKIEPRQALAPDAEPLNGYGRIPDFKPEDFIQQRKQLKVMSREIQLAVAASGLALHDAAFKAEAQESWRCGISLGAGVLNTDLDEISAGIRASMDANGEFSLNRFGREGMRALFPLWFLKYLPNMPACHVAIAHGFRGPSNTLTTSAAAGAQAIGEACRVIRRGDADLMLAGGTDSKINPIAISRFRLLGLLSKRSEFSPKAYCPFDARHDGLFLGEGAGFLVLEEHGHALSRGAKIYGEILGYGDSSDFNPDPRAAQDDTGKRLAMTRALAESHLDADDVDFILANGSGVPHEDDQEARAIHSLFERRFGELLVTGVKPITGHGVYAAGGIEIAAGLLALRDGVIPPLANFEHPAPACDLPIVKDKGMPRVARSFLFNSFGFGGQNACLAVRR